jgi:hypothetical protein
MDSIAEKCPFEGRRIPPNRDNPELEMKLSRLKHEIEKIIKKEMLQSTSSRNLTRDEIKVLNSMKKDNFFYLQSDKGGEFTIIEQRKYMELALSHLNNDAVYERLPHDNTTLIAKDLTKIWKRIAKARKIPAKFTFRLCAPAPQCQRFYHLIKTHKPGLAIRPIVSGCNGACERISWLLSTLLLPLLQHAPAHLNNTKSLLERLKSMDELTGYIPASLDVVSLYTSVPINEAIETICDYISRYDLPLCGLLASDMKELLTFILNNNVFQLNDQFYRQRFGLAMGSRMAPILAILTLDRLEKQYVFGNTLLSPILYLRYVDDIFILCKSREEASALQVHLNSIHGSIKFELEQPDVENKLSLLDVTIRITQEGQLEHMWYVKSANKGIKLHAASHVPNSIKYNTLQNEFQRVDDLSHNSSTKAIAKAKLTSLFIRNGYSRTQQQQIISKRKNRRLPPIENANTIFYLPFISDKFTERIRRAFIANNLNVTLRIQPGKQLRNVLQKFKFPRHCEKRNCPIADDQICFKNNVVYRLTCEICGEFYIGSTTRSLHERAIEHTRAAKNPKSYPTYAIATHYTEKHNGIEPALNFIITEQCRSELDCKISEAMHINKLHPHMNCKCETDMVYTQLLIT